MNNKPELETDPRFPSGRWIGFFVQKQVAPGRHGTELHLTFHDGQFSGEGRDWVGKYTVHGRYSLQDGRCHWTKQYLRKHTVFYTGFNEGKGIWGTWSIPASDKSVELHGGFHIWPEDMPEPTGEHLTEQADIPLELIVS
jgi:hypothetical protein